MSQMRQRRLRFCFVVPRISTTPCALLVPLFGFRCDFWGFFTGFFLRCVIAIRLISNRLHDVKSFRSSIEQVRILEFSSFNVYGFFLLLLLLFSQNSIVCNTKFTDGN
jgi:hypothetical protein